MLKFKVDSGLKKNLFDLQGKKKRINAKTQKIIQNIDLFIHRKIAWRLSGLLLTHCFEFEGCCSSGTSAAEDMVPDSTNSRFFTPLFFTFFY